MNGVRGRRDAQWLPSRFRFALFRLFAFVRLQTAKPQIDPNVMLMIERDQTAFENYSISAWVALTVTCYFTAEVFASWPIALAVVVSFFLSLIAVQAPIYVADVVLASICRIKTNIRMMSIASMSVYIGIAAFFATRTSWVRFAAWQFLALVALNAIAAIIVFLLRGSIAKAEAAFAA